MAGSVNAHVNLHVIDGDEHRLQQGRLLEEVEELFAHPGWPCPEKLVCRPHPAALRWPFHDPVIVHIVGEIHVVGGGKSSDTGPHGVLGSLFFGVNADAASTKAQGSVDKIGGRHRLEILSAKHCSGGSTNVWDIAWNVIRMKGRKTFVTDTANEEYLVQADVL